MNMNKEQRINQLNEIKADCALFVEQMKERMDTLTNNSAAEGMLYVI